MKIAIVIPLKAKKVAGNWKIVEDSLFKTLESIRQQTDSHYYACVVGHDYPHYLTNNTKLFENIDFVNFDEIAPPILCNNSSKNQEKFEKDRCAKIQRGYTYLLDKYDDVTHLFPLDADDLLHKDFVRTLGALNQPNYIIENGYFYYLSSRLVNKTTSFSTYCGSSAILSRQLLEQEREQNGRFLFKHIGHVNMRDYLDKSGIAFIVPQKRLVMYVRDNGENISRQVNGSFARKFKRNAIMRLKSIMLSTPYIVKKFGVNE